MAGLMKELKDAQEAFDRALAEADRAVAQLMSPGFDAYGPGCGAFLDRVLAASDRLDMVKSRIRMAEAA